MLAECVCNHYLKTTEVASAVRSGDAIAITVRASEVAVPHFVPETHAEAIVSAASGGNRAAILLSKRRKEVREVCVVNEVHKQTSKSPTNRGLFMMMASLPLLPDNLMLPAESLAI